MYIYIYCKIVQLVFRSNFSPHPRSTASHFPKLQTPGFATRLESGNSFNKLLHLRQHIQNQRKSRRKKNTNAKHGNGISPCSKGNASAIRVHFPASYVSLREWIHGDVFSTTETGKFLWNNVMSNHKRNSHELLWMEAGASYSKKKKLHPNMWAMKKGSQVV